MLFYRRLICYRGLPGSGKSTDALAYINDNPTQRCRANRDLLRMMLHGGWLGNDKQEALVTRLQMIAIRVAFEGGYSDVLVDDTNLHDKSMRGFEQLAAELGAQFVVRDLRGVPIETCIARDEARVGKAHVGEAVIRRMYDTRIAGVPGIPPVPVEPDPLAAPDDLYAEAEFGDEVFLGVQATAADLRGRLAAVFDDNRNAQRTAVGVVDQWMREQHEQMMEAAE